MHTNCFTFVFGLCQIYCKIKLDLFSFLEFLLNDYMTLIFIVVIRLYILNILYFVVF